MVPHLMRAQGTYKADKHATPTHTHTHTQTPHTPPPTRARVHTHTKNTSIVVMGLMKTEEENYKLVGGREEVGFQFRL